MSSYTNYKAIIDQPEIIATLAIEVNNPELPLNPAQVDESVNNWIAEVCPELADTSYSYTSTDLSTKEANGFTYYIQRTHYGVAILRRSSKFTTFPIF